MTMRQALAQVLLERPETEDVLAFCRNLNAVQSRAEIVQLRDFQKEREFTPRLLQPDYLPSNMPKCVQISDEQGQKVPYLLGDKMHIGQRLRLEGVEDSAGLRDGVTILGALYDQARNFGIKDLIYCITYKLQVAWNSYMGVGQCLPFLGVATLAFKNDYIREASDFLQTWFISFLAETYDLFVNQCHDKLLTLLRANPKLQDAVLELRAKLLLRQPEVFSDTRALLRSRGIGQL